MKEHLIDDDQEINSNKEIKPKRKHAAGFPGEKEKDGGFHSLSELQEQPNAPATTKESDPCIECSKPKPKKKCKKSPPKAVEAPKVVPVPEFAPIPPLKFKDYPKEIEKKAAYENQEKGKIASDLGKKVEHNLVGPKLVPT